MKWFCYILKCSDGSLYTGVTTDLGRRWREHNGSTRGAKYTRSRRPVRLVLAETYETKSQALRQEVYLKGLRAHQKAQYIERWVGDQRNQIHICREDFSGGWVSILPIHNKR